MLNSGNTMLAWEFSRSINLPQANFAERLLRLSGINVCSNEGSTNMYFQGKLINNKHINSI